jgi:hypothetical protein
MLGAKIYVTEGRLWFEYRKRGVIRIVLFRRLGAIMNNSYEEI